MSLDELLDLVSNDDVIQGVATKKEIYENNLKNFRVINVFIINDENKVFIPRRSKNKILFPSAIDCSVGGHVQSKETYDEAFFRETLEEVNIDVRNCNYNCIGYFTPLNHPVSAFMKLYFFKYNQEISYQKNDFESASWCSLDQIKSLIVQKVPSKGDFPFLANYLISQFKKL